jgi:hypothetical protein
MKLIFLINILFNIIYSAPKRLDIIKTKKIFKSIIKNKKIKSLKKNKQTNNYNPTKIFGFGGIVIGIGIVIVIIILSRAPKNTNNFFKKPIEIHHENYKLPMELMEYLKQHNPESLDKNLFFAIIKKRQIISNEDVKKSNFIDEQITNNSKKITLDELLELNDNGFTMDDFEDGQLNDKDILIFERTAVKGDGLCWAHSTGLTDKLTNFDQRHLDDREIVTTLIYYFSQDYNEDYIKKAPIMAKLPEELYKILNPITQLSDELKTNDNLSLESLLVKLLFELLLSVDDNYTKRKLYESLISDPEKYCSEKISQEYQEEYKQKYQSSIMDIMATKNYYDQINKTQNFLRKLNQLNDPSTQYIKKFQTILSKINKKFIQDIVNGIIKKKTWGGDFINHILVPKLLGKDYWSLFTRNLDKQIKKITTSVNESDNKIDYNKLKNNNIVISVNDEIYHYSAIKFVTKISAQQINRFQQINSLK